ncbi:HepT-like ribonuclease domain-containing protein [Hansschlegelia zhihuaiae]|uniref:DUF86 domain-containing protein n=1 Tax=Hansschlegelia zhihuaiae TaxID=405005 RepID=A0A4Q0MMW1_9HYPH|nr:HepT-like ribonuclease domain-containing protein [Hansschlegelia zhihuaiae]RXF74366.1 DUF86 domain-containing protein [Hansschlegelia zhihuaiae]
MIERIKFRLHDIEAAIRDIRELLDHKTINALYTERATRAAFERFLEILSEASRHVPEEWKAQCAPEIPWRRVADLGNQLRHGYKAIDVEILWTIYEDDLAALEHAVERMLGTYCSDG